MNRSPTRSALQLTLAFFALSCVWILFNHFGPSYMMVIDENMIHHDEPADLIFASVAGILIFTLTRRYLFAQAQTQAALQRTNDELELRVQERTADLDAERSKLRRILDAMPDGVCIIDQNYTMTYINPAMEQEWGAISDRRCYTYFANRTLPCNECHLGRVVAGHSHRWVWTSADSQKTYAVSSAALTDGEESAAALYIFHDITEETRTHQQIEAMGAESLRQAEALRLAHAQLSDRARELAALLEISHTMAATLESQPLLDVILDQMNTMIDYSSAILYVLEDDGITAVAYSGPLPEEQVIGLHVPLTAAPGCKLLMERGAPIIIDDIYGDDPLAKAIVAAASNFSHTLASTRAWMAVPLMVNERLLGMLRLDHAQPAHFSKHEADIALAIANHAAVAMENARLYAEAHKVAVLEERQRMARDLHDSVSQALYGIALGTHAAREQLTRVPEKLPATLDYVLTMSATAVAEMRALVFELRPDSLEQEGLGAALTKQADALRARTGAVVNVEVCEEPPLSSDGKEVLYRIAQEAMQNIVKHAQAANVNLRLYQQNGWATLEVCDDGIGFEPAGRYPGHYGLKTMRERALRLSGTLDIDSKPHTGSVVRARIPVANRVAA